MSTRVKTGLVAGSVFAALVLFGRQLGFGVMVAAVAVLGAAEYARIVQPQVSAREVWFIAAWAGVIVLGFHAAHAAVPGGLVSLGALLYLGMWIRGPGPTDRTLAAWGAALGAWILIAYFLGHALYIRRFGPSPILFISIVVVLGDTAAYYFGTAYGVHRLAPAVSPKKSVEGAAASLAAGILGAAIAALVLPLPHSFPTSVALGVVLNAGAQLGDLAESLIKRCAGVKDSGAIFPGHGGVLDRIDGFLFTVPLYASFLTIRGA